MSKTWKDIPLDVRPYLDRDKGGIERWRNKVPRYFLRTLEHMGLDYERAADRTFIWERYRYMPMSDSTSRYANIALDDSGSGKVIFYDNLFSRAPYSTVKVLNGVPQGERFSNRPDDYPAFPTYADWIIATDRDIITTRVVSAPLRSGIVEQDRRRCGRYTVVRNGFGESRRKRRFKRENFRRPRERVVIGRAVNAANNGCIEDMEDELGTLPKKRQEESDIWSIS